MVESIAVNELEVTLKPFYQRASEAEREIVPKILSKDISTQSHITSRFCKDRLSRLEAAIHSRNDTANEEHLKIVNDLQSKLEVTNTELISEKRKAQTLAAENEKLQYRIIHLLRSLKDADLKLEQVKAREQLESLKLQGS